MTDAGLDQFLRADSATRVLRRGGVETVWATPTYIRHKPGQSTIIAYELALDDGSSTFGYTQWCADSARAEQILAKAHSLRPRPSRVGLAVGRIDDHTVFSGFPNDARLRRLRWYVDPRKIKRSLAEHVTPLDRISGRKTRVAILRYKPERRVVVKVDLATAGGGDRSVLVRYSTQRRARNLAALATHLRRHGACTPAPLAQLDNGHVGIDEFVDGRELRDAVRTGEAVGAELGDALRTFHATVPPPHLPSRTAPSELDNARRGLSALLEWEPGLADLAASVADLLARSTPAPTTDVLIHGDLHAKNLLVNRGTITFVDLERVSLGPAAVDLGCFRAHAIALGLRQPGFSPGALAHADEMVERYRTRGGVIDEPTLGWHTAIGLVDQALLVTRHLEGAWQSTATALLDAARTQLEQPATLTGVIR